MDLKDSHFHYNALLKNEQGIKFEGLDLFPGLNEINFQSRTFQNYAECVKSCKGLMEDMTSRINIGIGESKYKVGAEVNPVHTGTQTLSKNWADSEVARFWVYDKKLDRNGSNIEAVCKGAIFAVPKIVSSQLYS